jgi:hypothetical protein
MVTSRRRLAGRIAGVPPAAARTPPLRPARTPARRLIATAVALLFAATAFADDALRHADGRQLQRVGIQPDIRVEPKCSTARSPT